MTLRSASLKCIVCNGKGSIEGPSGIDACRSCAAWAEREWQAAQRGQPLPQHLAPTPVRPRPTRDQNHHRSIA